MKASSFVLLLLLGGYYPSMKIRGRAEAFSFSSFGPQRPLFIHKRYRFKVYKSKSKDGREEEESSESDNFDDSLRKSKERKPRMVLSKMDMIEGGVKSDQLWQVEPDGADLKAASVATVLALFILIAILVLGFGPSEVQNSTNPADLDDVDSAKGRFESLTGGVWY